MTMTTERIEGTTAVCRFCGDDILLDQREGGGPGFDWGASPEDWVGNGGIGMDYGCAENPETGDEGTAGHEPIPGSEEKPEFTHGDVLDMRDVLDSLGRHYLIDAMLRDGLANDIDAVEQYAENEPTMIEDGWFTEYARELADDLGYMPRDLQWPFTHIDWERAADDLKMDYSSVEIDGRIYWVRDF